MRKRLTVSESVSASYALRNCDIRRPWRSQTIQTTRVTSEKNIAKAPSKDRTPLVGKVWRDKIGGASDGKPTQHLLPALVGREKSHSFAALSGFAVAILWFYLYLGHNLIFLVGIILNSWLNHNQSISCYEGLIEQRSTSTSHRYITMFFSAIHEYIFNHIPLLIQPS